MSPELKRKTENIGQNILCGTGIEMAHTAPARYLHAWPREHRAAEGHRGRAATSTNCPERGTATAPLRNEAARNG